MVVLGLQVGDQPGQGLIQLEMVKAKTLDLELVADDLDDILFADDVFPDQVLPQFEVVFWFLSQGVLQLSCGQETFLNQEFT
jgi:hypothetical protein